MLPSDEVEDGETVLAFGQAQTSAELLQEDVPMDALPSFIADLGKIHTAARRLRSGGALRQNFLVTDPDALDTLSFTDGGVTGIP